MKNWFFWIYFVFLICGFFIVRHHEQQKLKIAVELDMQYYCDQAKAFCKGKNPYKCVCSTNGYSCEEEK